MSQRKVEGSAELDIAMDESGAVIVQSASVTDLASIASFEDAIKLAQQIYGELIPSYELGDGFVGLDDKERLVGVPFVVMGWGLGWSAFADDERFSIVRVVTEAGDKYRFSDGSTGVHKQLMDRFDGDPANFVALVALGGLQKNVYQPRNEDGSAKLDGAGKPIKTATTFRINVEQMSVASVNR